MKIIVNQAAVIAEAVYATQLLIKKDIITREELLEVRKTLIHADSILSPGSSIQPKDSGTNVDSSGSGSSGLPTRTSDGGDRTSESPLASGSDGPASGELEHDNSDSPVGASTKSTIIGDIELVEPTEEGRRQY